MHPPWVKTEIAAMIHGQTQFCGDFDNCTEHGAPGQVYSRMAGFHQSPLFESGTSPLNTCFESCPRERVHKSSSAMCVDVRTLSKAGQLQEALGILNEAGISADSHTYVCLLQECIKIKDLESGRKVHAHIIKSGFNPNNCLLNTLVNMYTKCGRVVDARQVFDKMPKRDMFTWNIMIAGYAKHGCGREAFEIYEQLRRERVMPDKVTFTSVVHACASLGALEKGKEVHADIIKAGIVPDIMLETALADMYAKCGRINDACRLFNNMAAQDVVSWNAMIAGYAQQGCAREAFEMYERMIWEGLTPDKVTFICVLNVCTSLAALEKGIEVHANVMQARIAPDIILDTALVNMYAKCGSMTDACQVFDNMAKRDVVSWSAMIAGYAQQGHAGEALVTYERMLQECVTPDRVAFICVLNACASQGALAKGKEVHADISKARIVPDIILETALADMYAKCGSMKDAQLVFNNMAQRNVVSWNTMIAGYIQYGCGGEALEMYEQMIQEGMMPDMVTFTSVLNACASLAVLEKGREVHADIIRAGIAPDVILETALADMYAKCGSMKDARQVFDSMTRRNVVSWSAMIGGYAQHGYGREALQLFEQMQQEGFKPDIISFACVMCACSHVGLVEEGRHYLDCMSRDHGLIPTVEHFGCMVDLLGRAGQLNEAEDFIKNMPIKPDSLVWGTLLGASRIYSDVEVAERAAKCLL